MAESYEIVGQYPTIETLGGTKTRDVQAIQATTKPHGVYFETRLPKSLATVTNIRDQVNGYAIIYGLLFDIDGVVDVEWSQEPTAGGNLQDHVLVYFESSSGQSGDFVDVPYSKWTQDYVAGLVATRRARLDAVEAS